MKHQSRIKFLISCLTVLLLTALLQAPVLAEDGQVPAETLPEDNSVVVADDYVPSGDVLEFSTVELADADVTAADEQAQLQALCAAVREALLNGKDEVSLTNLKVTKTTAKQLTTGVLGNYFPYFDGDHIYAIPLVTENGEYVGLSIDNSLSAEETKEWVDTVDQKLDELVALIDDDSMSTEDKALTLHDYMASHYYYGDNAGYPGVLATEGCGGSYAYAFLFNYVMNRAGEECYIVTSSKMGHTWNILKVGNHYYHVDVTWDDLLEDRYGLATHDFFLKSDTAVQNAQYRHSDWTPTDFVCSDTSFEGAYYADAVSPVVIDGTKRYYVCVNVTGKKYELDCYDTAAGTTSTVANLGMWADWETKDTTKDTYQYCYAGLWKDHCKLYYNTWNAIMTYDPATGTIEKYADIDTTSGYVWGSVLTEDGISYELGTKPGIAYEDKTLLTLSYTPNHEWETDYTVDQEATCTAVGSKSIHCKYCNEKKDVTEIPMKEHSYQEEVVAPTIFSEGYTRLVCTVCGNSVIDENSYTDKLAAPDGWNQVDGSWYYFSGNEMKTGWQKIDSKWYYLDPTSGVRLSLWQKIDGKWYYLDPDTGAMLTGWQKVDGKWYYLNTSMKTGWQKIDGKWYYLKNYMLTGWQKVDGKWYYLKNYMLTGWQKIGSKWYYLNTDMKTGWLKYNNNWYYLKSNGAMACNDLLAINGKSYAFKANGVMMTNTWAIYTATDKNGVATETKHYFNSNGVMATGWLKYNNAWYYFDPTSGAMVSSKTLTIDGTSYTFNADGVWVK